MAARAATANDGALPRWQRVYAIATAAVIGAMVAYLACTWRGWTRLQYDPYRGRWWWQGGATQAVPINFYGNLLWALAGGLAGGAIGFVATRWRKRALGAGTLGLLAAWALTAAALAGTYYMWMLWPF